MTSFEIMETLERVQQCLQCDLSLVSSKSCLTSTPLCEGVKGGVLDNPGRVSVNMREIVLLWESCHSVVKGGGDVATSSDMLMDKFCTVLIESSTKVLATHRVMSEETLEQGDMANLSLILSGLTLVRNRLWHYKNHLANHKLLNKHYLDTCQLIVALETLLIEHHVALITTVLIVEKPFFKMAKLLYDGDKISNAVHMWWLHVQLVRHQALLTLPPKPARRMLAAILDATLHVFVNRYQRARLQDASAAHTQLMRSDISSLLLMVSELLPTLVQRPEDVVQPPKDDIQAWMKGVHMKCQHLMAILLFVTAPINELIDTLTNAQVVKDSSSKHSKKTQWSGKPLWFEALRPDLYSSECSSLLALRMLCDSTEPNFGLVVRVLLADNGQVALAVLSALGGQEVSSEISLSRKQCTGLLCRRRCVICDDVWPVTVVTAIFTVLLEKNLEGKVFLQACKQLWEEQEKKSNARRVWREALVHLVAPLAEVLVQQLLVQDAHHRRGEKQGEDKDDEAIVDLVVNNLSTLALHVPHPIHVLEQYMRAKGSDELVSSILLDALINLTQALINDKRSLDESGAKAPRDEELLRLQRILSLLRSLQPEILHCSRQDATNVARVDSERSHSTNAVLRAEQVYRRLLMDVRGQLALQTCHAFLVSNAKWLMHKVHGKGPPTLIGPWTSNNVNIDPFVTLNSIGDNFDCRQRSAKESNESGSSTNVMAMEHDWNAYCQVVVNADIALNLSEAQRLIDKRAEAQQEEEDGDQKQRRLSEAVNNSVLAKRH